MPKVTKYLYKTILLTVKSQNNNKSFTSSLDFTLLNALCKGYCRQNTCWSRCSDLYYTVKLSNRFFILTTQRYSNTAQNKT